MAGVSKRLGVVAFGKQTGAGVPKTSPEWAVPVKSGGIGIVRETDDVGVTSLVSGRTGQYVQRAHLEGSVTILAHPELLAFLLKHAMGDLQTTGSGPYEHVATMADDYPAVGFTFYSMVGNDWLQAVDGFITSLTIRGSAGENVEVEVAVDAKSASIGAAEPTYSLTDVEPRFKFLGSTFLAQADSGNPTAVDNIDAFEVVVARDPEIRYGTSLTPSTITPERVLDASATIVYDDAYQGWDWYHVAVTGDSTTPGSASQDFTYGSFDVTYGLHPSSGTEVLQLQSGTGVTGAAMQNWAYNMSRPEPDPTGGAVTMDVAGPLLTNSSGDTELTITVTNGTAGTAY